MTARRLLPITALAAATALTIGACANGGAQNGPGDNQAWYGGESDLTGELEIVGFGLGDEIAEVRHERALEALGQSVDVTLVEGGLDIQQFLSAVAAGDAPDLIYASRAQIGSLAARGAIVPLTDCIDGESVDTEQYREEALAQVTFDDEIYGIPEFNQVQLTMANSELLDAAGVSLDDVNGSEPEAMSAAAEALVQRSGDDLQVIGVDSKLPEFFPLWAKARGVDLLSEDGRTANLDDPKAVEALEWAVGIYESQGGFSAVKAFRDSADFFGEGNQFAAGELGAMPMEQWYLNVLNDVSPDAPLAFDAVRTPEGEPIAFAGGQAWAVPAGTDNGTAACRYATTMTQVDTWVEAAEARKEAREGEGGVFTGVLTGNTQADEEIRGLLSDADEPWQAGIDAMYEANEAAVAMPANPADAEFTRIWTDAINSVLAGDAEPADALATAQEEAQAALDEAWAEADAE